MFDAAKYYRNANRSDKATILLFAVWFFELGLAYSPILGVGPLADFSACVSSAIPAFCLVETAEARTYMTLTTMLTPIKIWLGYFAEWEGKSFGDLICLPSPEEKITVRMIVCFVGLLFFMGTIGYFCFGHGVLEHWHRTFLISPFDPFKIWWGWAVFRLIPFCFSWSLFFLSLRTYFARLERNAL